MYMYLLGTLLLMTSINLPYTSCASYCSPNLKWHSSMINYNCFINILTCLFQYLPLRACSSGVGSSGRCLTWYLYLRLIRDRAPILQPEPIWSWRHGVYCHALCVHALLYHLLRSIFCTQFDVLHTFLHTFSSYDHDWGCNVANYWHNSC